MITGRSTKAGARTPATPAPADLAAEAPQRSTKAGARTPATRWRGGVPGIGWGPLNEGRGANPGDTPARVSPRRVWADAQRRPGREPRRHALAAAASAESWSGAQRRPGREPRRHREYAYARRFTSVSAQRRPGREPRRHDRGRRLDLRRAVRSTKAGARTPATRRLPRRWCRCAAALNEGRGANPGDTCSPSSADASRCIAQRRPGREPRRHPRRARAAGPRRAALNEGRGANPGDTRGPAVLLSLLGGRSTKAGARTPATQPGAAPRRMDPPALNEGRGANPGDTGGGRGGVHAPPVAQRRPGREPRRHLPAAGFVRVDWVHAQRRPGREPRRHLWELRHGGTEGCAQRRPGREPRRHLPALTRA